MNRWEKDILFESIFKKIYKRLYLYATYIVGNVEQIKDLVSEVFSRL